VRSIRELQGQVNGTPILMYIPTEFAMDDEQEAFDFIESYSFAELITSRQGELKASHVPLLLDMGKNLLLGHFARNNDHWQELETAEDLLVIFQGPHTYVTPSWYESEQMVPTWNYVAVHVKGKARLVPDSELLDLVTRLSDKHESQFEKQWTVNKVGDKKLAALLRAIVGFKIDIEQVSGKAKLSQNRKESDQKGVIRGLQSKKDPAANLVAKLMVKKS
jgi:transcriptional regulator